MILSKGALFAAILAAVTNRATAKLVINEIMRNPTGVATEREGEWFEVFNPNENEVDMNGWTIKDDHFNNHRIQNGGPLIVVPFGYLVLGNNGNLTSNGNVTLDYVYDTTDVQHNNNDWDELVLLEGILEIDRVAWDGGAGPTEFPNTDGSAMALYHPTLDNNIGSNWCDALTVYGDKGNHGTPGGPNICPSPVIVINEVMRNPKNIESERLGEWIELYNPSDEPVDINGWTMKDDGTNKHKINNGGPLLVPGKGYLVLGSNANIATNGGVAIDYEYDADRIKLNNAYDELVLLAGSVEVDRVNWDGLHTGTLFPNRDGHSMALMSPDINNNVGSNWCNSETPYGNGDFGTPGAANDCPPPAIVINEIMRNPKVTPERQGEWFELFNPSNSAVDIEGWIIKDNHFNKFTIDNGAPLVIPPGGYLVLGNNADFGTNGGVILDYEYDGTRIQLNNNDDELVLLAGDVLFDTVEWDAGAKYGGTWPNTNGKAMALRSPWLDNNDSDNWCDSESPFGDGDFGTPGGPNDCPPPGGRRLGGIRGS